MPGDKTVTAASGTGTATGFCSLRPRARQLRDRHVRIREHGHPADILRRSPYYRPGRNPRNHRLRPRCAARRSRRHAGSGASQQAYAVAGPDFTVHRRKPAFRSGLPQGAYFGAGAVVASYFFGPAQGGRAFALVMTGLTIATIFGAPIATFVGQHLGWRDTYTLVAGLGVLALAALWTWV